MEFFETAKSPENFPKLPGMSDGPEMIAGFERYRKHYEVMQKWMGSYSAAWRNHLGIINSEKNNRKVLKKGTSKLKRKQRHVNFPDVRSASENISCDDDDDQSVEFDFEVSEEWKEFFIQSQKHRDEREKRKLDEVKKADDGGETKATKAPKERPGTKRNEEMKVLYGKYTPMIQGLETAVQMEFDHVLDRKQPELWPSIALNFT